MSLVLVGLIPIKLSGWIFLTSALALLRSAELFAASIKLRESRLVY
jgi:hypothetical protein